MTATVAVVALSLTVQLVALWLIWRRRTDRFRLLAALGVGALAARSIIVILVDDLHVDETGRILEESLIFLGSLSLLAATRRFAAYGSVVGDPTQYTFLDRTPLPVFIKNADGRYAFVNRAFEETFNIPLTRAIGRKTVDLWPEEVATGAMKADSLALERMTAIYQEFRYEDPNGETSHWIATKFPLTLGDQAPVIGAVIIDITDQKRVEEELARRDERYQLAVYGAGIWDWNIETDELYVSPKFCELLGYAEDDSPLLDRAFVAHAIHPDDYDRHKQALKRHFEDPSSPYESEQRYRSKSGGYRWFRVTGHAVIGPDGRAIRVAGLITDIDAERSAIEALRESEARMSTLLDNSPAAVYFKDASARFLTINRRYTEVYGVTPSEVVGRTSSEIYGGDIGKSFLEHDQEVIRQRKLIVREERFGDKAFLTAKFPVILPGGRLLGVAGIETEITERIRTENEIRRSKEAAETANRAKSMFLANMSHELRTPLNSIIGFSEILLNGVAGPIANEKQRDYLQHVSQAGQMLLHLINDILDLSRIEAGKIDIDEAVIDIPEIFASAVQLISERARRSDVVIADNIPIDTPFLRGDRRFIKQIFLNLLSNAVKFSPTGGVVRVGVNRRRNGSLSITFSDNGPGIPEKDIPRVQLPFVQIADTMTRHHEGTGLGLPIVKSLMERHGGSLEIASQIGVGTTVTVNFPASRVVASPQDVRAV